VQPSGLCWHAGLNSTASILVDRDAISSNSSTLLPTPDWRLPSYIKPIPDYLIGDDLDYLWKTGALSIPETPLLNELLRSYAEYVHPTIPVVEFNNLLQMINRSEGEAISLILFQAMMFTASAFVDETYLYAGGYTSRIAAQRALYQKSKVCNRLPSPEIPNLIIEFKVLYEFDYERDRFCCVRSLLLLTYWYETPYDQKDTRHWLNIAISLAYTIGLHRNQEGSGLSVKTESLWKRVWWCCYMRDRLVAFATKGITRIGDGDFNVQMLTADDFGIDSSPSYNPTASLGFSIYQDEQAQRDLAALFIAKAKLCLCISHFLRAEYSVLCSGRGKAQRQEKQARFTPSHMSLDWTCEANVLDAELMDWAKSLTSACRDQTLSFDDIENGRTCIVMQRALLHMLYFAVASAVHKSQALQTPDMPANALEPGRFRYPPCKTLRIASDEIMRISMDLLDLKLERYLPTSSMTSLLYAIRFHLLHVRSPSDFLRQRATQGLEQCMAVLESLRTRSASANYACRTLEPQIKSAHIRKSNFCDAARQQEVDAWFA
jgi:hypothetical protein